MTEDPEPDDIPLTFYISLTYLNLKALWPENAVQVSWGLDLYQASPAPVLTVPLQNNNASAGITATLQTQTNNHNPSLLMPRQTPIWGSGRYKTIAELVSQSANAGVCVWVQETNCFYRSSNTIPDESLLNGLDVIPQSVANRWWYRAEHTASLPFGQYQSLSSTLVYGANTSQPPGRIFQLDVNFSYSEEALATVNDLFFPPPGFVNDGFDAGETIYRVGIESRPITTGYQTGMYSLGYSEMLYNVSSLDYPEGWPMFTVFRTSHDYHYRFSGKFVSVPFVGSDELELFDNFPIALFRHDLDHVVYRYLRLLGLGYYGSLVVDSWELPEHEGRPEKTSYIS